MMRMKSPPHTPAPRHRSHLLQHLSIPWRVPRSRLTRHNERTEDDDRDLDGWRWWRRRKLLLCPPPCCTVRPPAACCLLHCWTWSLASPTIHSVLFKQWTSQLEWCWRRRQRIKIFLPIGWTPKEEDFSSPVTYFGIASRWIDRETGWLRDKCNAMGTLSEHSYPGQGFFNKWLPGPVLNERKSGKSATTESWWAFDAKIVCSRLGEDAEAMRGRQWTEETLQLKKAKMHPVEGRQAGGWNCEWLADWLTLWLDGMRMTDRYWRCFSYLLETAIFHFFGLSAGNGIQGRLRVTKEGCRRPDRQRGITGCHLNVASHCVT